MRFLEYFLNIIVTQFFISAAAAVFPDFNRATRSCDEEKKSENEAIKLSLLAFYSDSSNSRLTHFREASPSRVKRSRRDGIFHSFRVFTCASTSPPPPCESNWMKSRVSKFFFFVQNTTRLVHSKWNLYEQRIEITWSSVVSLSLSSLGLESCCLSAINSHHRLRLRFKYLELNIHKQFYFFRHWNAIERACVCPKTLSHTARTDISAAINYDGFLSDSYTLCSEQLLGETSNMSSFPVCPRRLNLRHSSRCTHIDHRIVSAE